MPSVYNYRHVELDKVGRGKRVIQPPGGQTADIFGSRGVEASYSSASSQAGSDVASSRVHLEMDQQSIGGQSSLSQGPIVDGMMTNLPGQMAPNGGMMAEDFKPVAGMTDQQQQQLQQPIMVNSQQQQPVNPQQQKLLQMQQQELNRSPKKTIPVLRRNPITGEIIDNPANRQPTAVRVRQPPGGRSSGIF